MWRHWAVVITEIIHPCVEPRDKINSVSSLVYCLQGIWIFDFKTTSPSFIWYGSRKVSWSRFDSYGVTFLDGFPTSKHLNELKVWTRIDAKSFLQRFVCRYPRNLFWTGLFHFGIHRRILQERRRKLKWKFWSFFYNLSLANHDLFSAISKVVWHEKKLRRVLKLIYQRHLQTSKMLGHSRVFWNRVFAILVFINTDYKIPFPCSLGLSLSGHSCLIEVCGSYRINTSSEDVFFVQPYP